MAIRMKILEQSNKELNEKLLVKDKEIEELKNKLEQIERTATNDQPPEMRSWTSLFVKDTKNKNTENEIILMAKIRDENQRREEKERNIEINGIPEGTNSEERTNEEMDWIKICDMIREIGNDSPQEVVRKVYRRGNKTRGTRELVVEFKNKEEKNLILRDAKKLKDSVSYGNVY